jgi:hypothetical protein
LVVDPAVPYIGDTTLSYSKGFPFRFVDRRAGLFLGKPDER